MTPFPLRNRWTSNLSGRSRTASPDHHGPAQLHIAIHQYQSQKRAKNFAQYKIPRKLAVPRGVEPPTFGLGNRCSKEGCCLKPFGRQLRLDITASASASHRLLRESWRPAMAIYKILQIAQRKHSAPANFRDNRALIFPDQVAQRLFGQVQRLSRSRVA